MSEVNTRVQLLNAFLAMPHGKLSEIASPHRDALTHDPLFYGHLAVWYSTRGEVRDHKALFVAYLLTADFPELREAGWMLLQDLPPHLVAAALDHAKSGIGKAPRIFKNAVITYLRGLEKNNQRFDRAALRDRNTLKHLYASLHIKPSERAQQILFAEQPPESSPLFHLKVLAHSDDPQEQAVLISTHRIPYTTAVGAIKQITPAILVALIDVMTPQEVINHLKALKHHGAFAHEEVKEMVEAKLERAETDTRVSTLKATRALANVTLDEDIRQTLTSVTDRRIANITHIERPTALFVDKSGSMTKAIELAKEIAALVSAVCTDFHVMVFDTEAFDVTAEGSERSTWEQAFKMVKAGGGTSIGAPLAKLMKDGHRVEEIIVVTDGGENTNPYFRAAYAEYMQVTGLSPHVIIVAVDGDCHQFAQRLEEQGIATTTWAFTGDYYSLPNLLPLLALPTRADLVAQIMALPLPARGGTEKVS